MYFKKDYVPPALEVHVYCVSGCILTGSLTDKAIKAGNVTVHDFERGSGISPEIDFNDVSFD